MDHLEAVGGTIWTWKVTLVGTVRVTVGFVPLITCLAIGGFRHIYIFSCLSRVRANSRCQVSLFPISQARIRQRVARAKKKNTASRVVVKTMYPCFEYTPDGLYGSRQHFRNANVIVTRDLIRSSGRNWRATRGFRVMWRTKGTLAYLAMVCSWRNIYLFANAYQFVIHCEYVTLQCIFAFLFLQIEKKIYLFAILKVIWLRLKLWYCRTKRRTNLTSKN